MDFVNDDFKLPSISFEYPGPSREQREQEVNARVESVWSNVKIQACTKDQVRAFVMDAGMHSMRTEVYPFSWSD